MGRQAYVKQDPAGLGEIGIPGIKRGMHAARGAVLL